MNFAMIARGLATIQDQPIATFQSEHLQFALCIVACLKSGNVPAGAQPLSPNDRFPRRCRRGLKANTDSESTKRLKNFIGFAPRLIANDSI